MKRPSRFGKFYFMGRHAKAEKGEKLKKFRHGEIKEIILSSLGISVLLAGTFLVTPNFPIVFASLLKMIEEIKGLKIPKWKVKRVLRELEKKQLVELERKGYEVYVKVKEGSRVEILRYSLKELLALKKKKAWGGKWFLATFDVPEKERIKRYHLRKFLKEIGFYPYQQSVYVFPYECKKEIELVKKIVEGAKYLNYIVAESLERETELKTYYGLK